MFFFNTILVRFHNKICSHFQTCNTAVLFFSVGVCNTVDMVHVKSHIITSTCTYLFIYCLNYVSIVNEVHTNCDYDVPYFYSDHGEETCFVIWLSLSGCISDRRAVPKSQIKRSLHSSRTMQPVA